LNRNEPKPTKLTKHKGCVGDWHNRAVAGKQPVGMLPKTLKKGFESFACFVTNKTTL